MIGLIIGDIVGSVYERHPAGRKDFPLIQPGSRWTDDTVLALAVADALLSSRPYGDVIRELGRRYPHAGYGGGFKRWLYRDNAPAYNSWGNGSAMRVTPIAYAFNTEEQVLSEAEKSASVTHDHPEGIKGAQAIALSVFLARTGSTKEDIRDKISKRFTYDLDRNVQEIQRNYHFEVSCQKSVPEAIIAFLDSTSYEDTIRNAVFLGGDSDTQAAMSGAIAEAFYRTIPENLKETALKKLPDDLLDILQRFTKKYTISI